MTSVVLPFPHSRIVIALNTLHRKSNCKNQQWPSCHQSRPPTSPQCSSAVCRRVYDYQWCPKERSCEYGQDCFMVSIRMIVWWASVFSNMSCNIHDDQHMLALDWGTAAVNDDVKSVDYYNKVGHEWPPHYCWYHVGADGGLSHKKTPCFPCSPEIRTDIGAMSKSDGLLMKTRRNLVKSMVGFLEKPAILSTCFLA